MKIGDFNVPTQRLINIDFFFQRWNMELTRKNRRSTVTLNYRYNLYFQFLSLFQWESIMKSDRSCEMTYILWFHNEWKLNIKIYLLTLINMLKSNNCDVQILQVVKPSFLDSFRIFRRMSLIFVIFGYSSDRPSMTLLHVIEAGKHY